MNYYNAQMAHKASAVMEVGATVAFANQLGIIQNSADYEAIDGHHHSVIHSDGSCLNRYEGCFRDRKR